MTWPKGVNGGEAAPSGKFSFPFEFISRRGLTPIPLIPACHPSPGAIVMMEYTHFLTLKSGRQLKLHYRGEGSPSTRNNYTM